MNKNQRWYVSVMALALASCGGGSGGGGDGGTTVVPGGTATPLPTPTATSTPAPTPTASPTPAVPTPPPAPTSTATFQQLSGAVVLQSANTGFNTKTNPPVETGVNGFGKGARYIYDLQARSMTVESGGTSTQFVAAEIDASAPAGTTRYTKADGSRLSLITPGGDAGLRWTRFIDATLEGPDSRVLSLTGMPTPEADIPTTGTASFTRSAVIGEAYVQSENGTTAYVLDPSTATMTVDYATRRITFNLTLTGRPVGGGASLTLLTASGSSNMDGSSPADMKASSPIISRYLSFLAAGGLFGPQGAEVGTTFSFRGTSDDGKTVLNFAGLAAGGH